MMKTLFCDNVIREACRIADEDMGNMRDVLIAVPTSDYWNAFANFMAGRLSPNTHGIVWGCREFTKVIAPYHILRYEIANTIIFCENVPEHMKNDMSARCVNDIWQLYDYNNFDGRSSAWER